MSWQAYIDDSLLATGCVDRALIFGHDGNVWASSDYFEMKDEERNVLLSSFLDPSQVRMNGLFVCGEKFLVLRTDERSIYARKGTLGVCCVKTSQAVIVGAYDGSKIQAGDANKTVEGLADYLIESGY